MRSHSIPSVNYDMFGREFEYRNSKTYIVVFYIFKYVWWQIQILDSSFTKMFKCVLLYIFINHKTRLTYSLRFS